MCLFRLFLFERAPVGLTLGLELGLKGNVNQEIAAVIIFLRLWRLVRAGHGVFTLEGEQIAGERAREVASWKPDFCKILLKFVCFSNQS